MLKALIYLTFPAYGLKTMGIPTCERARVIVYPGIAFLMLAGLLGYHLLA